MKIHSQRIKIKLNMTRAQNEIKVLFDADNVDDVFAFVELVG